MRAITRDCEMDDFKRRMRIVAPMSVRMDIQNYTDMAMEIFGKPKRVAEESYEVPQQATRIQRKGNAIMAMPKQSGKESQNPHVVHGFGVADSESI